MTERVSEWVPPSTAGASSGLRRSETGRTRERTDDLRRRLEAELGAISPELILVSPPEIARLARELLPPLGPPRYASPAPVPQPAVEAPTPAPSPAGVSAFRSSFTRRAVCVLILAAAGAGFVLGRIRLEPPALAVSASPPPALRSATVAAPGRVARPLSSAQPPAAVVPARTFAWPTEPRAAAYIVTFYAAGKVVFRQRVVQPRLGLPTTFRFKAGRYRWRVVPILGGGRVGAPLVDSTFTASAPPSRP